MNVLRTLDTQWRRVAPWCVPVLFLAAIIVVLIFPCIRQDQALAAWAQAFGTVGAFWWTIKLASDARLSEERAWKRKVEVARTAAQHVQSTAAALKRAVESRPNSNAFLQLYNPAVFVGALNMMRTIPVAEIGDAALTNYCATLEAKLAKAIERLDREKAFAEAHGNSTTIETNFVAEIELDLFNAAANVERYGAGLVRDVQKF